MFLLAALSYHGLFPGWLDGVAGFLTSCPHRTLTGQPCPLCGTVTAGIILFGGDSAASLAHNPLALGLLGFGLTQPLYRLLRVVRPRFSWGEELAVDGFGLAWLLICVI